MSIFFLSNLTNSLHLSPSHTIETLFGAISVLFTGNIAVHQSFANLFFSSDEVESSTTTGLESVPL